MKRLFSNEWRRFARDPLPWALAAAWLLLAAYGWHNGAAVARARAEGLPKLLADAAQERAELKAKYDRLLATNAAPDAEVDWPDPRRPWAVGLQQQPMLLPVAPLAALAIGQSDLLAGRATVGLWERQSSLGREIELANPAQLVAGRFDFAFVAVVLLPLLVLVLAHDLVATDRETGTLRMALAQPVSAARLLGVRLAVRAALVGGVAAAGLALGLVFGRVPGLPPVPAADWLAALFVLLAYAAGWLGLAGLVNAAGRTAAGNALGLGVAWLGFTLVLPATFNVLLDSLHPLPSRAELVARERRTAAAAEQRGAELLAEFYQDHPELRPATETDKVEFSRRHLGAQEAVALAVAPVTERFHRQLAAQQALAQRLRWLSPAVVLQDALTGLAGTGARRHLAFREQVAGFVETWRGFFAPKIFRREPLARADLDQLPEFTFAEPPGAGRRAAAGAGTVLSALAAGLLLLTADRARRLSPVASVPS